MDDKEPSDLSEDFVGEEEQKPVNDDENAQKATENTDDPLEDGIAIQEGDKLTPFLTANKTFKDGNSFDDNCEVENITIEDDFAAPPTVSEPRKPKTTAPRRKRTTNQRPPEPTPSDGSLRDKALRLEPIAGFRIEEYETLLAEFYEKRKKQAEDHQFHDGAQLNTAIEHLQKYKHEQEKVNLQMEATEKYEEQVDAFRRELADFDNQTNAEIEALRQKHILQQQRLEEAQDKECEENYYRWQSEAKMRQYNRASHQLMVQRKQLARLLQQCRFNEAELVQEIVNRMEAEERAEAAKVMQHDYNESVRKLEMKHNSEIEFIMTNASVQMTQLKQRREMLRQSFLNKQKKLDKRGSEIRDKDRLWAAAQAQRTATLCKESIKNRNCPNKQMSTTIRAEPTSTTIQLPPLQMKKPIRRNCTAKTVR